MGLDNSGEEMEELIEKLAEICKGFNKKVKANKILNNFDEHNTPEMVYREHIYDSILQNMKNTYIAKNHDYGNSVSETFDKYGLTSFLVRMEDKMNRLYTLNKIDDAAVRGEKIEDTLLDLANYSVLALLEIKYRTALLLEENEITEEEKWKIK
jgi:hypothetical protein